MTDMYSPQNKGVSISDLASVFSCPRRFYFQRTSQKPSFHRYTICKQVALTPNSEPDQIWNEILMIAPETDPSFHPFLIQCLEQNKNSPIRPYTQIDLSVRSEKYGIYGQIDKYDASSKTIAIVRCNNAPSDGCWPGDRLRLAAYLLCLNETAGLSLSGGYVEYIPSGIVRFYGPQPKDRRALIRTIHQTKQVLEGYYPEKPLLSSCNKCQYKNKCVLPPVRTLSERLFKQRK